jgi:hypothetical protein
MTHDVRHRWLLILLMVLGWTCPVWAASSVGRPVLVPSDQDIAQTVTAAQAITCGEAGAPTGGSLGLPLTVTVTGSPGAVTITANPRITAGVFPGQLCILKGASDSSTVTLATGNGLTLSHTVTLKATQTVLVMRWTGTVWYGIVYPEPSFADILAQGRIAIDANDEGTSIQICNANLTTCLRLWCTTTECTIKTIPAQDQSNFLTSGKSWGVYNASAVLLFGVTEAGAFTGTLGSLITSGTQTRFHKADLMTVSATDGNAFVNTADGTNFDYTGIVFADAVTGCTYWKHRIQPNLATTPAWNLAMLSKSTGGAGGNVVLTVSAKVFATNVAWDAALTALHTTATFAISTSANTSLTTLSGTNYDATVALSASNMLVISFCRVGGNAGDTINADWLLIDLQIRYAEQG